MSNLNEKYNLSFFYTLTGGGNNDIYKFEDKKLWGPCKTIKHCVFETRYSEDSDFHISIADTLNEKWVTNIQVIPRIVSLPNCDENLRKEIV
jgi:hypothetical protein